MITFLTSNPGGLYVDDGQCKACKLNEDNGFVGRLKHYWKTDSSVLIISSDPEDYETNDSIKSILKQSFPMSDLSVSKMDIWDSRTKEMDSKKVLEYDVVLLSGGHVPTQNAFFAEIQLQKILALYTGILIGISAGTMNCAKIVYAQPELEGEAVDPGYKRFLTGLDITDLMILPHYQDLKDDTLDGFRVIEDITFADSKGKEFLFIPDGSYVLIDGSRTTLYGEGYLIADGKMKQVCELGNSYHLNDGKRTDSNLRKDF